MLFSAVVAMDLNGYRQLNALPLPIFNHQKACPSHIMYIPTSRLVITPMNTILIQMTGFALKVSLIMRLVLSYIRCAQMTSLRAISPW
jgi:hypothetical protein